MEEQDLITLMDSLSDTQVGLDLLISERDTLKQQQIPPEIQMELENIDDEFKDKIKAFEDNIKVRKEQLQDLLKKYAKPVKSKYYSWSYTPGKAQWNTDALDGYALDHRDILWMRGEESKPTTKLTPLKR